MAAIPTTINDFFADLSGWQLWVVIIGGIIAALAFVWYLLISGSEVTKEGDAKTKAGARAKSITEFFTIMGEGIAKAIIRITRYLWVKFKLGAVLIGLLIAILLIALAVAYFQYGSWNPIDGLRSLWSDLKSLF